MNRRAFATMVDRRVLRGRWTGAALALMGTILVLSIATVPLDDTRQSLLAVATVALFLAANRVEGHGVTIALVVLSCAVSLRYIIWRVTETLEFNGVLQAVLGTGLAMAEFYAVTVMVLGYIQTIWMLDRKPVPMPDRVEDWPTVDVYIPTYNESLSVVRATVLAALAMDYPRDKVRVYILDDGRRSDFRDFAASCGAGYITRPDNNHAKAGNLNHAMRHTDGTFIAIFDCDHVPTRAFLQMTVGWLVRDAKLALVQTPHHFYSPDPFQRNLAAGTRVPSEGNMFYCLVQNGNDFWDAAFFCGSCAVIRRAALQTIGGFAIETVTEDAHTALRLQRHGWATAYLKMPLAAGLATERLALHIGQRMRWARGMLQILRTDNPLFGRGLRLGQRVCYFNAMMHFLFAVPRLVFLSSPLAYLVLDQNIIAASPLAILAYAGPHIVHAVATNSRIQGSARHSFWSEIYETVMAPFLVRLTIVTLMSPKRGKFNVTDKGGLLKKGYFDVRAVYPNLILVGVLGAGWLLGVGRLIFTHPDRLGYQALILNTVWLTFSLLIVTAALAVGRETRQVRTQARVRASVPATIYLPDGRVLAGSTREMSLGGSSLLVPRPDGVPDGAELTIEVEIGSGTVMLPARLQRWRTGYLQVTFAPATIADESNIVQAVFGRADAWVNWDQYPRDRVLFSLWTVLVSIAGLFRRPGKALVAPILRPPATAPSASHSNAAVLARQTLVLRPRGSRIAAGLMLLLVGTEAVQARPADPVYTGRERPAPTSALTNAVLPPPPVIPPSDPAPTAPGAADSAPALPAAGALTASEPRPESGSPGALSPGMRRVVLTLGQLGAQGPMTMRGTSEIQGVLFGIRADEVVMSAELTLSGALSPALIPKDSNVDITLNEQYVGTIPADRDHPTFGPLHLKLNPVFFQDNNRLNFRFTGRYTNGCNDSLSGLLWATVSDASTLTLTLARLPPQHNLSEMPTPFFDPREGQTLVLPFVVPEMAGNTTLKAAAIVSSWFGRLAGFRGARFPVAPTLPAEGNAVMLLVGKDRPAGLLLRPFSGPTLAVVANPTDPFGSILVVGGRNEAEAQVAATTLALGTRLLGGDVATVEAPEVPDRQPYDAPAWIPTDRPVRFGELVDAADLQGVGYTPGTIRVPFNTSPDLYTWRRRPFTVDVRYRAPPGPVVDVATSRLDAAINGQYLRSYPLATPDPSWAWIARSVGIGPDLQDHTVQIPPYTVFGRNELQFSFDARPMHRGACVAIPGDIHTSIDPDSTIDLSRAYHFTQMPNLAFLVNSGFPFTRMADLSNTAVVLPERMSPLETTAFLDLAGYFGSLTGYPVLKLEVVRPSERDAVADRDLILLGTLGHLADATDLLRNGPVHFTGNHVSVALPTPLTTVRHLFGDRTDDERANLAAALSTTLTEDTAMLAGMESPLHARRSLTAFLAVAPQGLTGLIDRFRDSALAPSIQGDFVLFSGHHVTAYRVGSSYTVGSLPLWLWPEWLLRDRPLLMLALLIVACGMLALPIYWTLRRRAAVRLASHRRAT